MNGTALAGFAVSNGAMGTEWSVLGTGDFNQDGRSDVLWENAAGTVDIWEMNGANLSGFVQNVGTAPANSHFAGVGHFGEMNGGADIVWVDSTNHVKIWQMSNGNVANVTALNGLDGTEWHLEGVGNFAGDANSDLLWVSNTGAVHIWEVNGANVTEIPVTAPTGSTLQLSAGAQSEAVASTSASAATSASTDTAAGGSSPQAPVFAPPAATAFGPPGSNGPVALYAGQPPLILAAATDPQPLLGGAGRPVDPAQMTHTMVGI
jgi:hypothetical protein